MYEDLSKRLSTLFGNDVIIESKSIEQSEKEIKFSEHFQKFVRSLVFLLWSVGNFLRGPIAGVMLHGSQVVSNNCSLSHNKQVFRCWKWQGLAREYSSKEGPVSCQILLSHPIVTFLRCHQWFDLFPHFLYILSSSVRFDVSQEDVEAFLKELDIVNTWLDECKKMTTSWPSPGDEKQLQESLSILKVGSLIQGHCCCP